MSNGYDERGFEQATTLVVETRETHVSAATPYVPAAAAYVPAAAAYVPAAAAYEPVEPSEPMAVDAPVAAARAVRALPPLPHHHVEPGDTSEKPFISAFASALYPALLNRFTDQTLAQLPVAPVTEAYPDPMFAAVWQPEVAGAAVVPAEINLERGSPDAVTDRARLVFKSERATLRATTNNRERCSTTLGSLARAHRLLTPQFAPYLSEAFTDSPPWPAAIYPNYDAFIEPQLDLLKDYYDRDLTRSIAHRAVRSFVDRFWAWLAAIPLLTPASVVFTGTLSVPGSALVTLGAASQSYASATRDDRLACQRQLCVRIMETCRECVAKMLHTRNMMQDLDLNMFAGAGINKQLCLVAKSVCDELIDKYIWFRYCDIYVLADAVRAMRNYLSCPEPACFSGITWTVAMDLPARGETALVSSVRIPLLGHAMSGPSDERLRDIGYVLSRVARSTRINAGCAVLRATTSVASMPSLDGMAHAIFAAVMLRFTLLQYVYPCFISTESTHVYQTLTLEPFAPGSPLVMGSESKSSLQDVLAAYHSAFEVVGAGRMSLALPFVEPHVKHVPLCIEITLYPRDKNADVSAEFGDCMPVVKRRRSRKLAVNGATKLRPGASAESGFVDTVPAASHKAYRQWLKTRQASVALALKRHAADGCVYGECVGSPNIRALLARGNWFSVPAISLARSRNARKDLSGKHVDEQPLHVLDTIMGSPAVDTVHNLHTALPGNEARSDFSLAAPQHKVALLGIFRDHCDFHEEGKTAVALRQAREAPKSKPEPKKSKKKRSQAAMVEGGVDHVPDPPATGEPLAAVAAASAAVAAAPADVAAAPAQPEGEDLTLRVKLSTMLMFISYFSLYMQDAAPAVVFTRTSLRLAMNVVASAYGLTEHRVKRFSVKPNSPFAVLARAESKTKCKKLRWMSEIRHTPFFHTTAAAVDLHALD